MLGADSILQRYEKQKMRCFIAIDLPDEIKNELTRIQKLLPDASMKLVEPSNLHLTLAFLGEVTDFEANKIKEALKQIRQEKFIAHLGKIGVFPSESFIRVAWTSLEPVEKFNELNKKIILAIKQTLKIDERFESHVTLARVKNLTDKQEFIGKLKKIQAKQLEFEISSFVLKKSTLTGEGPVYEDIIKFDLI